jgi:hypothetical protein
MTHEILGGCLHGEMDAKAWEAIIPSIPIFALAKNLQNFDEAGISDRVAEQVCAKLSDPEVVARSRMFPFRFGRPCVLLSGVVGSTAYGLATPTTAAVRSGRYVGG